MNAISFRSEFMMDTNIYRLKKNKLKPQIATIVEFEPNSHDIQTLNEFNSQVGASENEFSQMWWNSLEEKKNKVYGITIQRDSFDKIKSDKLLGIATISGPIVDESDSMVLNNIRLRPEAQRPTPKGLGSKIFNKIFGICEPPTPKRKFKGVGTALLEGLKCMSSEIWVFPKENAHGFFKKNGFSKQFFGTNCLSWFSHRLF